MSKDPEIQRIDNQLATIADNQVRFDKQIGQILEVLGEFVKAERSQNSRIEENSQQIATLVEVVKLNTEQIEALVEQGKKQNERIDALREQGKEQDERINALIRIVEGHISDHQ